MFHVGLSKGYVEAGFTPLVDREGSGELQGIGVIGGGGIWGIPPKNDGRGAPIGCWD